MEKRLGLVLLMVTVFYTQMAFAQLVNDSSKKKVRGFLKLKIGDYDGLEWEQKIGKKSVVDFFGGAGLGLNADGYSLSLSNSNTKLIASPVLYSEYRDYYNLISRLNKKKTGHNNSGNFLFGRLSIILPIKNQNYFNLLFIQGWGAQRKLGSKISIDCHLGIIEHFYYDKPPYGGFRYIKLEPLNSISLFYVF